MQKLSKIWYSLIAGLATLFFIAGIPLISHAEETTFTAEEIKNFSIDAKAAFSVDFDTGKILYDQEGETPMGIASVTKIISLYLVAEQVKEGKLTWEDPIEISQYASDLSVTPDLSNVPLHRDVQYTVKDLYEASYIQSANAAVVALAEKIAGSEPAFVDQMKDKLTEWGITDAKIVNASGLNNTYLGENLYPGSTSTDENELSAKDVAIVARHLLQDFPEVLEVTSTVTKTFGEGSYSPVEMVNWNWMLPGFINAKDGVDGLKTGTTDLAGACFVGTAVRDDTKTVAVKNGKELTVPIAVKKDLSVWVRKDMDPKDFTTTIDYNKTMNEETVSAPVAKATNLGKVTATIPADTLGYMDGSKEVPTTELITTKAVEKANIFVIGWRSVANFFTNLF